MPVCLSLSESAAWVCPTVSLLRHVTASGYEPDSWLSPDSVCLSVTALAMPVLCAFLSVVWINFSVILFYRQL